MFVCVCICVSASMCVVVVAKKNDANPVTLTCRTNVEGDVTWTFQLEDVDIEENIQQNGLNLSVSAVDIPMLGKYSCWRGEEMLSSTYLLLEAEELGKMLWFHFPFFFIVHVL